MPFTFKKSEKLRGKTSIAHLFEHGSSFIKYPFRIVFLTCEDLPQNQVLFNVPKRLFKKAVHRNLIRRRMSETYRLQKQLLENKKAMRIAFLYIGKEIHEFAFLNERMTRAIKTLNEATSNLNPEK